MPALRRVVFSLFAGLLLLTAPNSAAAADTAEAAASAPPWIDLDRFLEENPIREVRLSPQSDTVAYLLHEDVGASLWLLDPHTGAKTQRLYSKLIESVHWSSDGRALFIQTPERVGLLPIEAGRPRWISQLDREREQRWVGVDPTQPQAVLVTEKVDEKRYRLLRITDGQPAEPIHESDQLIRSFLLDANGEIEFVRRIDGEQQVIVRFGTQPKEVLRCSGSDACSLLAKSTDGRTLYLRGHLAGDRFGLFALDLRTLQATALHHDPEEVADLAALALDPNHGTPLAAHYDTDRRRAYGLTPGIAEHIRLIAGLLPGWGIDLEPRVEEGLWLVTAHAPQLAQDRYYLYAPGQRELKEILRQERNPQSILPAEQLVDTRFIQYQASDGMTLYGFVSAPARAKLDKTPLVVRVHGGPWNHVRPGFDRLTQFLVNRGYIVFQPNFRSSTGYGRTYVKAGRGKFGNGRVQQDMLDGLEHLLAQGIGDRDRVGMLGHSFGGFSTLGALAFTPKTFRVGIASAPPINLIRALSDLDPSEPPANGVLTRAVLKEFLVDLDDPQAVSAMRRQSPEYRLGDTVRPLLIFAGGADPKVDVVDVKHYAAALDQLGRDVSLLVDDTQGHSFNRNGGLRAYLYMVERFLAHHLGGETRHKSDLRLLEYIDQNLRLEGPSLKSALTPTQLSSPEHVSRQAPAADHNPPAARSQRQVAAPRSPNK